MLPGTARKQDGNTSAGISGNAREHRRALLEFSISFRISPLQPLPTAGKRHAEHTDPVRKQLKRLLPKDETIRENRWLRPFANSLLHPRLWHLNRHSAAGAVAVGLACGLIPGPFQMPGAALCCVLFRVNLPLALFTTLYTNPFTLVPIYIVAYKLGAWVLQHDQNGFAPPPELGDSGLGAWLGALFDWFVGLGAPLALGLVLLAALLAPLGYVSMRAAWRVWLIRSWHLRKRRAAAPSLPPG